MCWASMAKQQMFLGVNPRMYPSSTKNVAGTVYRHVKQKKATIVAEYDISLPTDKDRCLICASLVLSTGDIVIADNNNKAIKIYDADFRIMSVFQLNQFPTDMCTSNTSLNEVYVTDIDTIHHVRIDNGLDVLRTVGLDGEKWGITTWKHGLAVAITLKVNDNREPANETRTRREEMVEKSMIRFLNFEGFIVRTITNESFSNFSMKCPFHMTSIHGGRHIVVSDSGTNRVTCLDTEGGVVFVYEDKQLKNPTSLTTDGHGSVFIIGQYSGNVHQITENGTRLGVILSEVQGLNWPGGICFDSWNNSIILQTNGFENRMQSFSLTN